MDLFHDICGLKRLLIKYVLRIIILFKRTKDIKKLYLMINYLINFKFEYQNILCLQSEKIMSTISFFKIFTKIK